jgi:hypothetical protein
MSHWHHAGWPRSRSAKPPSAARETFHEKAPRCQCEGRAGEAPLTLIRARLVSAPRRSPEATPVAWPPGKLDAGRGGAGGGVTAAAKRRLSGPSLPGNLRRSSGHGRSRPLVGRRRRRRSYGRLESSTVDDAWRCRRPRGVAAGVPRSKESSWPGRERVWSRFHSHSTRAPAIRGSVHAGVRRCGMLPS